MKNFLLMSLLLITLINNPTFAMSADNFNGEFTYIEGNALQGKVDSEFGYNDNFLLTEVDKKTTSYFVISPSLFAQKQINAHLFQFLADSNLYKFTKFKQDSHSDISTLSKYHLKLAHSQKLFVTASFKKSYEYRGEGLSLANADTLLEGDNKKSYFVNTGYLYGHENSIAKAEFLIGKRGFSYSTRRNETRKLDLTGNYLQANFDYLISGKSYFSSKIQVESIDYQYNDSLNRKQYSALIGLKWKTTSITELAMLFGYEKASFNHKNLTDIQAVNDQTSFVWQGNITWQPIERITFNASTNRNIMESDKLINSITISDSYSFRANYVFSPQWSFSNEFKVVNKNIAINSRSLDESSLVNKLSASYQWRDWLAIYANYKFKTFDSSEIDFDVNSYSIGLKFSI